MKKSILQADTDSGSGDIARGGDGTSRADASDVASRIAHRSLEARGVEASNEVRRLLDAGREVMRRSGTRGRPRVADIVAAAGLSNDAFYRYFPSKDRLVAAILDDGTQRLRSYLAHQMSKATSPEDRIRRWVEGVLSQAVDDDVAATTLAVLWNAGSLSDDLVTDRPTPATTLATLLDESLAVLGSRNPRLDADLVGHAVVGVLSDHLWNRTRPGPAETDRIVEFCLALGRPD